MKYQRSCPSNLLAAEQTGRASEQDEEDEPKATASIQDPLVLVSTQVSTPARAKAPKATPSMSPTPPRMMMAKALMSRMSPLSGVIAPSV